MNEDTPWIVKFVCFFGIPVKIHTSNNINTSLTEATGHTATSTEEVYGLEFFVVYLLSHFILPV